MQTKKFRGENLSAAVASKARIANFSPVGFERFARCRRNPCFLRIIHVHGTLRRKFSRLTVSYSWN